ncbi:L7Ae/L30e/S12e/Gadd45 family ribosomal protein [Alicyclobacillus fastidiosus]|uniref:Ribosomal L7Ae/L30e/S12e/Gadd45 family protein n=1 Tax=Alicyclobacillus fastidiosus TaxID=392011 RepID=A0ABV5AGU2_9BACL|nr:ribosomal L7Ae/L30e/S12e/Gadd45 family protein [Alicyclobacillus fastidiosus]WEH07891.1 ribosomal L7Ae/L30e/S12e/Gadd45 family protein [Alicyclobacillus fastidiosus]
MSVGLVDKVFGLIGLARRAGAIVDGQERILAAIASAQAKLVVVTEDAGANGRKKLHDKANTYGVPCVTFANKVQLGRAIGRDAVAAIAVSDAGFAAKLLERFGELNGGGAFDESSSI